MLSLLLSAATLLEDPARVSGFEVVRRALIVGQAVSLQGGALEFPPIEAGFREALVSWNVDCPAGTGVCVELRVRASAEGEWSPWLYVGDWGVLPALEKRVECELGRIAVDFFQSKTRLQAIQPRVRAFGAETRIALQRFDLTLRDRESFPAQEGSSAAAAACARLPVPFRSQKVEAPAIAGRICSPTSVAMLLHYRGVDVATAKVAELAYDPAHEMYGNWPRNVQAAYTLGVPGYVTAFSTWEDVRKSLASGQPLVISIAAEKGQLSGAPYASTEGHLLVLCGIDEHGDCLVNDPAAPDAASGVRSYQRVELERCWLGRGGTAYVLLAPKQR